MKANPIITKDGLKQMLKAADAFKLQHIVGRALVVLFERQTASEKNANSTDEDNGVGFASCDAKAGSLTAKSYLRNKGLVKWQVDKWMAEDKRGYPRICKYHAQLNTAAVAKAALKDTTQPAVVQAPVAAPVPVTTARDYQAAKDGEELPAHIKARMTHAEVPASNMDEFLSRIAEKNEFARREAAQEQQAYEYIMARR